eukprot:4283257-Amphidinium_carterae.3
MSETHEQLEARTCEPSMVVTERDNKTTGYRDARRAEGDYHGAPPKGMIRDEPEPQEARMLKHNLAHEHLPFRSEAVDVGGQKDMFEA